ncbi:UDP-N-acetylmuramyl tripeptide synthase [Hyella patelloides LEGE 07179]|uniref:Lipid II isoglutaminyl synthase (glutamine-hydrolyzing) subunit MurT n=1 Tax=Hyella patelloides LEGE 07179 TaxID=945734 RepID=A0A563VU06_9CYAN|nr:Mur ligase family protein [Hyella patelloides]VEP14859.1 UDP-N-acetylmuramyl tripeptide synthase [Hyella patelloides LEGE 07179]
MQPIDRIRLGLAVGTAKTVTKLVKTLNLGAASVLPGEISRRLHPRLLPLLFKQVNYGVILVVGTNGKTTTALLLRKILEDRGFKVTHNSSGANLINGLTTALLVDTKITGKLDTDYAILEVDENILPLVLKDCQPQYILALNLFRDQLDRYGEVDTIAQRWQKAISPLPSETTIILNADDPTLAYLGHQLSKGLTPPSKGGRATQGFEATSNHTPLACTPRQKVLFFGLNEPQLYLEEIPHAVDSIYCPSCGHLLDYQGVYLSHLGDYNCPSCGFAKSKTAINSQEWPQILIGVYNKYNTIAAGLLAETIGIQREDICHTIKNFKAAFGRAEELTIDDKQIRILLSKNPVGMNETIRAVTDIQKNKPSPVTLLVLNDRIPDGTDVSWIWDVDTETLTHQGGKLIISGDRTYDMALRLKYSESLLENPNLELIIQENLTQAISTALEITPPNETLHILPTYSAMLEVRENLVGRKIL